MANHFHHVGLNVGAAEEFIDLINKLYESGKEIKTDVATYVLITLDENIEIWLLKEERSIVDFQIHYKTDTRTNIKFDNWANLDAAAFGLAYVWNSPTPTEDEFPMNLCIPNAGELQGIEKGRYAAQVVAFAEDVAFYKDESAFRESGSIMAPESFLPSGVFQLGEGEADGKPSAYAIINAKIDSIEKKTNSYSGSSYFLLKVHTVGFNLDVLVAEKDMDKSIGVGGIVSTNAWLSGHIYDPVSG